MLRKITLITACICLMTACCAGIVNNVAVFGAGNAVAASPGEMFYISSWAEEEFDVARGYGLIPESVYFKDYTAPITRVDFCETIVALYENLDGRKHTLHSPNPFTDTSDISVRKAYELSLISGVGEGCFDPWSNITRQQAAVIMTNLMAKHGADLTADRSMLDRLQDAGSIDAWAIDSVAIALSAGCMQGTGNTTFSPQANISIEQAVIMAARYLSNNSGNNPNNIRITSHSDNSAIPFEDQRLSWNQDHGPDGDDYTVYFYDVTTSNRIFDNNIKGRSTVIYAGNDFSDDGDYYTVVRSGDNVFSKPLYFYTGESKVIIDNDAIPLSDVLSGFGLQNGADAGVSPQFGAGQVYTAGMSLQKNSGAAGISLQSFVGGDGNISINWNSITGAADYAVEIQESRASRNKNVTPAPLRQINTNGAVSLSFPSNTHSQYEITVYAVNALGQSIDYSDTTALRGSYHLSSRGGVLRYDEISHIDSIAAADAQMRSITVNVWKMGADGGKYASTASLTVHQGIADVVADVFEEIFNGPEQFPIKDVGGYSWRSAMSSGRLSEHNYGTAIDINANENFCVYSSGSAVGSYWKPYEDPYSITPYGDVVNAFEKHGFTWGGDAWDSPYDYMHFSYFGR